MTAPAPRFASLNTWLLAGILCVAAALRLTSLNVGHPDEIPVVRVALALSLHDLNPHAFFYGSFTFYLFKIVSVLWTAVYPEAAHWGPDAAGWYLLFRTVSAIFGIATVLLAYLLGKCVANAGAGLLAAAMLAVSPLAVGLSSLATVDAIGGFWSALAWLGIALWAERNVTWADYLAGAAVGAAMATKFNAAFLLLPIILTALQKNRSAIDREPDRMRRLVFASAAGIAASVCIATWAAHSQVLAAAAGWTKTGELLPSYVKLFDKILVAGTLAAFGVLLVAVGVRLRWGWSLSLAGALTSRRLVRPVAVAFLVFCIISPYAILDLKTSAPDFLFQVNKTILGRVAYLSHDARMKQELAGNIPPIDHFYFVRAIAIEWGLPTFLLILLGGWLFLRNRREVRLPFAVTLAVMLVMTMGWRYQAERYLYPLWPLLCLLGGLGLSYVFELMVSLSSRLHRFSSSAQSP